jgi:hypothetical protein
MDAPLNILVGVALTAFPLGCLFALRFLGWRGVSVAILGAGAAAAIWAIGYGIYGWQHRMDWEHIRNYPLWMHIIAMTFSAIIYALVGFLPALAGVVLLQRSRKKQP